MKNMFIEHVVNRTLSTKSETPESMITLNLSPNFGLYDSKINQFSNPQEENKEQYVNPNFELPDSVSSQKTEKHTHPETIIDYNEQSTNFKEDDITVISEKKIPNLTNMKNQIEEKSQEKNTIVADEASIIAPSVPSKITKNTQIQSPKKEISLENSPVTNTEKHESQIEKNEIDSTPKQLNTNLTNDKPDFINATEQNSFVTNLKEISKKENITTKNIVQTTENKINNVKLDVTKLIEKKIKDYDAPQIKSKDNNKNMNVQSPSISIEPSKKTSPIIKTPYVENVKKNNTNIVTINIDRIEVKTNPPTETKNYNSTPNSKRMSLSEYLQLRKKGAL